MKNKLFVSNENIEIIFVFTIHTKKLLHDTLFLRSQSAIGLPEYYQSPLRQNKRPKINMKSRPISTTEFPFAVLPLNLISESLSHAIKEPRALFQQKHSSHLERATAIPLRIYVAIFSVLPACTRSRVRASIEG